VTVISFSGSFSITCACEFSAYRTRIQNTHIAFQKRCQLVLYSLCLP